MYLISLSLRFETKILDIAYLLMLKLMKEPNFEIDGKFIKLYLKVLTKQGKYKEALDFIEQKSNFFESDKFSRQLQEANLHHSQQAECYDFGKEQIIAVSDILTLVRDHDITLDQSL